MDEVGVVGDDLDEASPAGPPAPGPDDGGGLPVLRGHGPVLAGDERVDVALPLRVPQALERRPAGRAWAPRAHPARPSSPSQRAISASSSRPRPHSPHSAADTPSVYTDAQSMITQA